MDLTIVVRCKDNQALDEITHEIIKNHSQYIKDKLITSEIKGTYMNTNIFSEDESTELHTSDKQNINIDEIDTTIIKELSRNCRISLVRLSKITGLSPKSIKYRIKELEKKKIIIGYKTKINFEKLGYLQFRVYLHIKQFNYQIYNEIKEFLKRKKNTGSISHYIGYADIDFRCYYKNITELYELITEIKDRFVEDILEVNSVPIFDWKKIEYY